MYKIIQLDLQDFIKNPEEKRKELKFENNIKHIFDEIITNKKFQIISVENSKLNKEKRTYIDNTNSSTNNIISRNIKLKSKKNIFCFNQKSFKTSHHYYNLKNEIEIMSTLTPESMGIVFLC